MASYQIARGGEKSGPFEEEVVRAKLADGSILASDLCWAEGMETWLPVGQVLEIEVPAASVPAATAAAAVPVPQAGGLDPHSIPQPPTYMGSAILATLVCCLPLGIVSIVHASKVSPKYQAGDYHGALEASKKAKKWSNIAVLAVIIPVAAVFLYEHYVGGAVE